MPLPPVDTNPPADITDGATTTEVSNEAILEMTDEQLETRLKELEDKETTETGAATVTVPATGGEAPDKAQTPAATDKAAGDKTGTPAAAGTTGQGPGTAIPAATDTPKPITVPPEVKAYLEKELPNYKGDLLEIVKSHKEQSGLIGRHGEELGRLRKELHTRSTEPPVVPKRPARVLPDWMPKADQTITDELVERAFNEAAESYGTPEYAKLNRKALQLDREAERRREEAQETEALKQREAEDAYVRDLMTARDTINTAIPGFYGDDGTPTEAVAKVVIDWGKANKRFTDEDLARFNFDPHGGKTLIVNAYHEMQREQKRDGEIAAIRDEMNRRLEDVGKNITKAARSPQVGGAQTGGGTGRGPGLPSDMTDDQILAMGDKEIDAALAAAGVETKR